MSEFSRETLLNIIETDHVQCGEASALARMALAAMDSEPVEMPLDYLQGHKDGLEWAAQLAEANHPETGDWLYDDPIELAKAIRKGPDMPPAQPAADSEPVAIIDQANLDYLRSGADADVWPPEREEMGDVLLYRHAQPVPVSVPDEIQKLKDGRGFKYVKDGVHYSVNYANGWNQCRVAMLASAPQSPGSEPATVPGKWIPVSERLPEDSGRYWCYVEEQNDLGNHTINGTVHGMAIGGGLKARAAGLSPTGCRCQPPRRR